VREKDDRESEKIRANIKKKHKKNGKEQGGSGKRRKERVKEQRFD
jgi:hypothetical protein